MAPSLRDLIDSLLSEIALCGDQGASPADILAAIDIFYKPNQDAPQHQRHTVDRPFQEKVWTWLTRNPEVSVGKDKEGNHLSLRDVEQNADPDKPVRLFVSKERTWLAITGHEPDETKVLPMEFALLSIIALRKSEGIAQTELVKVSGQDGRSVPKRTDSLQKKGYIEKRAIQIKSARTSLCTLRKFINTEVAPKAGTTGGVDDLIDFKVLIGKLFGILREYKIISRDDLKRLLGFTDPWRWRVLSRALRKFERIGVLKRVRALSQYADTLKKYHSSVMLIREPTDKDIEFFHEFSRTILSNLDQDDNADMDEDLEPDGGTTREPQSASNVGTVGAVKQEEKVEEVGRVVPTWTADRNIQNLIFDTIHSASISGMTNISIIRACFGGFFRRPLENALTRLVECWQLSQPPHLRHLAIVRDTSIERTILHYIHYSAINFQKLVDSGEASWEAVEFAPRGKNPNLSIPPVDARPQLNEYGLPIDDPKKELLKSGNCTLLECISAGKPRDYNFSGSDPMAVRREDGTWTVRYGRRQTPAKKAQNNLEPWLLKPEDPENPDVEMGDAVNEMVVVMKPPKKPKRGPERFEGMSEKEKLKALGLDETWTEYNVLLIDRPAPGVYVTPRGRRRPVGEARGRPRISRIAVFKSAKLSTLPWFVEEKKAAEDDEEESTTSRHASQTRGSETPVIAVVHDGSTISTSTSKARQAMEASEVLATPSRGSKRKFRDARRGRTSTRPAKQRRLNDSEDLATPTDERSEPPGTAEDVAGEDSVVGTSEFAAVNRGKRKRAPSPNIRESEAVEEAPEGAQDGSTDATSVLQEDRSRGNAGAQETHEAPAKRPRNDPQIPQAPEESPLKLEKRGSIASTTHIISEIDHHMEQENQRVPATPTQPLERRDEGGGRDTSQAPQGKSPPVKRWTGGSLPFLRKKILMEIIEKAGGAYPMGMELWYPFATAWLKTKYKERPDMRTLKSTIKQLVDTGKLRQTTFSGKDSKGIMVTKKILILPDIRPDDAVVQEMQRQILNTEDRYYLPPNVEVDKSLVKSSKRAAATDREVRMAPPLPVEDGVTVQLHQKPASYLKYERRRAELIQKRLLGSLERDRQRPSGVVRLLAIQRPSAEDALLNNLTSISRPQPEGDNGKDLVPRKRLLTGKFRAAHAMLMGPIQTFHPGTGTFSTDAGFAAVWKMPVPERRPYKVSRERLPSRLPGSLEDLFSKARRRVHQRTTEQGRFFLDTNVILRWELQNEELFSQEQSADLVYINQSVQDSFEPAAVDGDIRFDVDEEEPEAVPVREPVVTRRRAGYVPLLPKPISIQEIPESVVPSIHDQAQSTPQNRRLAKLSESMTADQLGNGASPIPTPSRPPGPRQPARRQRIFYQVSQSLVQKIMTAIVVVRTLAGGSEGRIIDWALVSKCFPGQDPKFIQERGRSILSKSRLAAGKMQSDFQERFIDAYAKDQVPRIDYDNLEEYDWEAVVDWAHTQLDIPAPEKLPDLPATRDQFDAVFDLRVEAPTTLDSIFQGAPGTVNRKRALFASVPLAVPLSDKASAETPRKTELSRLEVAKTWVRANIAASDESYRPAEARQALEYTFGSSLISSAVQSLVTERAISLGNRGRITPGRNYDLTPHFIQILRKRAIDSSQLLRAVRFKTSILDPELRANGVFDVKYNSEDGDILAMINLAAEGRVVLNPHNPPRDKYGLTEGGYMTRQIDKDKLRFTVEVRPTESYTYGYPIEEAMAAHPVPSPPRYTTHQDIPVPEKIPIWLDIHGNLIDILWELVVGAVIGCVAMRPGINALAIAGMLKPTMGAWEVQLLLEWMGGVGLIESETEAEKVDERSGWMVKEWWWMVLRPAEVV